MIAPARVSIGPLAHIFIPLFARKEPPAVTSGWIEASLAYRREYGDDD